MQPHSLRLHEFTCQMPGAWFWHFGRSCRGGAESQLIARVTSIAPADRVKLRVHATFSMKARQTYPQEITVKERK